MKEIKATDGKEGMQRFGLCAFPDLFQRAESLTSCACPLGVGKIQEELCEQEHPNGPDLPFPHQEQPAYTAGLLLRPPTDTWLVWTERLRAAMLVPAALVPWALSSGTLI